MSKYTTQLRWIVEQLGSGLDVPEGQEYANAVYKYIGLDKYPIYDEYYRPKLNDKIINHFYFREIGFETAAQFAWYMRRTMNEIMPKYNRLYETLLTDFDHPLADWTRHRVGNIEGATTSDTDTTGRSENDTHDRNVFQDTPMNMLSNEGSPSIENLDYATTVTYDDSRTDGTTSGTSKNKGTSITDRIEDEYGRNRSLASLINEFAEKFVDIDLLIIGDLETLFMGLW